MKKALNIVLVYKTGGDFTIRDVDLIARHILKETTVKVNIYCLTDIVTHEFVGKHYTLLPFTVIGWKGWWSKMNLFAPALEQLRPFLFFDLDTVINGDISVLIPKDKNTLYGINDFYVRDTFMSAVMWIPNNKSVFNLWNLFYSEPFKFINSYKGDQNVINKFTEHKFFDTFTDQITTAKPLPLGILTKVKPDKNIICFHGKPRMRRTKEKWVMDYINDLR